MIEKNPLLTDFEERLMSLEQELSSNFGTQQNIY